MLKHLLSFRGYENGNFLVQSDMEKKITEEVNREGYGALGLVVLQY